MSAKRVGVVGSRRGVPRHHVRDFAEKLAEKHPDATVVSGRARGVDTWIEEDALELGLGFEAFPADWTLGKLAGKIRNWQLAGAGLDELAAFWDGWSNGTAHAVTAATRLGVRAWVFSSTPSDLGVEARR